jgi:hypothetical protein
MLKTFLYISAGLAYSVCYSMGKHEIKMQDIGHMMDHESRQY